MKKKALPRVVASAICATLALTSTALAQNSDPKDVTVEVRHDSKDSKTPPIVQEKEPLVNFLLEAGYESEYNFRGTNLMPNSDGGFFYQVQATVPKVGPGSLTMGVWVIDQIGDASSPSWSISEGGGGGGNAGSLVANLGGGNPIAYTRFPTTTQTSFREIDLFASYKFSLGPVDVTLGNIGFLIHREAQTSELGVLPVGFIWVYPPTFTRFATFGPEPTVQDENFDRIYVRLSSSKIPHFTPQITYYQTIYNNGNQKITPFVQTTNLETGVPVTIQGPGPERNEELGGYLEGRLNGNFPVGHWLDINPYGLVSVSFRDRTVPDATRPFSGSPHTGFNHAQAGLELDFHITPNIAFVPFGAYAYHISDPPIGTDRNEFWAGVKFAVNLP